MRNKLLLLGAFFLTAVVLSGCGEEETVTLSNEPASLTITSPAFEYKQNIPAKYTCDGENISPPLQIAGVPDKTQSLVLIVDDPDAPAGIWTHWVVWNIDPKTRSIKEGQSPRGATEGTNSFGKTGYGGPCPPSGTHRYFFKLHALDEELSLSSEATIRELSAAMKGHVVGSNEYAGKHERK
jgi:hypothetical protein